MTGTRRLQIIRLSSAMTSDDDGEIVGDDSKRPDVNEIFEITC